MRTITRTISIFIFLLLASRLSAGQALTDSLQTVLSKIESPRHRAVTANDFAALYSETDSITALSCADTALVYAQMASDDKEEMRALFVIGKVNFGLQINETALDSFLKALAISDKKGYKDWSALISRYIGRIYKAWGVNLEALEYYKQALAKYKSINQKDDFAKLQVEIGAVYEIIGDYDLAYQIYSEAAKNFENIADKLGLADSWKKIGNIHQKIGDHSKAFEYYQKSMKLFNELYEVNKQESILRHMADCYESMGKASLAKQDLIHAKLFFDSAFKIYLELGDKKGGASSLLNNGIVEKEQGNTTFALSKMKKALEYYSLVSDDNGIATSLNQMGRAFLQIDEYDEALEHLEKSLDLSLNIRSKPLTSSNYQYLAVVYEKKKNFKKALEYQKEFKYYDDNLFNAEKNKEITRIQIVFETDSKEKEILMLKKNQEIQELKVREQQEWLMFFVVLVAVALLGTAVILRMYRQKAVLSIKLAKNNHDLHVLNERLIESEMALSSTNLTKDKFFSIVAHDLKSPLNSVLGFTDMLSKFASMLTIEEIQKISTDLNKSVKSLYSFLDNLLTWSRAQMSNIDYTFEVIILEEAAKNAVGLLISNANNKKIEISTEFGSEINVWADRNSLDTILRNLIANAIKFTKEGGQIRLLAEPAQEGFLKISVADNGVGMPKEVQDKIFRIDSKHSTVGTANEKGTGLGLLICKEFVEENGGLIWVESEEGKGTVFSFTLPLPKEGK